MRSSKGGVGIIVLKIIGIIVVALLVLILLLMAVPIDFVARRKAEKPLSIYFRICRIPIHLNQKKKKKKKEGKLLAILKRASGAKRSKAPISKDKKEPEFPLQETLSTVYGVASEVLKTIKRCKIIRFKVNVTCGGEDAPLTYGTACAVVYPLAGWLEENINLRRNAMELCLGCDDDHEGIDFAVDFVLRIRLWRVLATLWRVVESGGV